MVKGTELTVCYSGMRCSMAPEYPHLEALFGSSTIRLTQLGVI